ncbi:T9SS type A sorting domain-containing protein [Dyadobacter sp. CY261]|uniref:T9SS type A sorting domain-containing protein n=1 Tax=Dyadobacter sp. CY261 TaxID=2907203 RepID=UPI001F21A698|nr:T9SS type A sorting domain-containing protein [Dyadobacter sp. CY261]MCF0072389.1 T9SS type A sorting domain-containing protein [Dyadobacter sp. CY261]
MRHYLPYLFWVVFGIISFTAHGQINIDFPSDRAVFQRDKGNKATIYIAGSYTKVADKIEAKLTKLTDSGTNRDWATVKDNPQGGFFSGVLTDVQGGWYRLEIRALKGGQVIDTRPVDHVGVGEVFMIAGQSNGEGYRNDEPGKPYFDWGVQGAGDDRVSAVNHMNVQPIDGLPSMGSDYPYPSFTHVDSQSDIAPRGRSAWNWGRLGDRLASKLGVPVLFYNVAWYGTHVAAWRESISGAYAKSFYADRNFEPAGMPYSNMRDVIRRYTSLTGLRGILWIQGEADNDRNTGRDEYFNDLRTVIEASRNESGKNISWMVSQTSYNNRNGSDNEIIEGQAKVINNVPNVFQGPQTDLIQTPRTDAANNLEGVHFMKDGLTQLADAWYDRLNDDFFNRSEPYSGMTPLSVVASCAGNGNVTLTVENSGVRDFSWTNGGNSNSVQVGNGTYRVTARDDRNNLIWSPEIRISEQIQPNQPTISIDGSNPVCVGNTATLVSSSAENATWNTGATGDRLPVTVGGDYFVKVKNIYGCEATSEKVTMKVVTSPLPDKPKITASGVLTFCQGGEVTLTSDSKVKSVWSNGVTNPSITAVNSGDFRARALNEEGCYSPESDVITVKVNPLPAKPQISLSGETTFCDGGNVTMTSNYDTGNIWSTTAITKTVSVTATGTFSLTQRDGNGCESKSDEVAVKVNPLPATPAITALRPTTFCDRDYTRLRSSEAYLYQWSNGSTEREIEIRTSGNFTISAKDANGCISPVSPVVQVVANPLPPTPVITSDGPTTFCADLSVNLTSTTAAGFLWSNGASTQTLKVTIAGTYSVQTINEFQCYSDPSNQIATQTLALPPSPTVTARQATTFCDGDTIFLKASNGNEFFWNNGLEGDSIEVVKTGDYAARIMDDRGCYSPYSASVAVEVKPSPTAPTIKKVGVYTLFAENNLDVGDHVWKYNDVELTENSATLKAVRAGNYVVNNTIVYSSTLTCASEFSEPFLFYLDTANPGFVAYPNPNVTERVAVETLTNVVNAEVQIIDSRGVIHRTFKVAKFDSQQYFNLSGLSSGIYFIRVTSASLNATQKLVIVR